MHPIFSPGDASSRAAIPILFASEQTWSSVRQDLDRTAARFAETAGFEPKVGRHLLLPGETGLAAVLFGIEPATAAAYDPFLPGCLPALLPPGRYRFGTLPPDPVLAALAFALGSYQFGRYRRNAERDVKLELPAGVDGHELSR